MINRVISFIKNLFDSQNKPEFLYRIVSVDDSYLDSKKFFARIQLVGTNKMFDKPIAELYQTKWLNAFSKEDVAQIAVLYAAEQSRHFDLISFFQNVIRNLNKVFWQ